MGEYAFDKDRRVAAGPAGVFEAALTGRWNGTAGAATRFVSGGYHEEDFEVWDSAGALVAQSRQLALLAPR